MIDDKTQALIAAILTIPIANRILEGIKAERYQGQGIPDLVDSYFKMKKLVKRRFDDGG
ncbi:MAG: hypothetical protein MUP21_03850 [Dehalococcoidia bacterium]|jgi:hypothetical protein|nr:hypothetical protein [Dehalococcoidia bacterium]